MNFLQTYLDTEKVKQLSLAGRGGFEIPLLSTLRGARREGQKLFDATLEDGPVQYKIEIKRQADLQWFDIPKYHQLSDQDKKIIMVFFLHKNSQMDMVAAITLEKLLDLVLKDEQTVKDGWTEEVIATGFALKQTYPTIQYKVKLKVRQLIQRYPEQFEIVEVA